MPCRFPDRPLVCALIACLPAALLLSGCGKPDASAPGGKPVVFVSVVPQADFVTRLAGDKVDVQVLVGSGQDPHHYAVEPAQSVALGKAAAFFTVGMPFEESLVEKIKGSGMGIRVYDTAEGIERMAGVPHGDEEEEAEHEGHEEHDHDHAHDHGDEQDPHVWTAPLLVKKQAAVIAKGLEEIDPANASFYREGLATFEKELDALHLDLAKELAPFEGRRFYVFHPAFGYFAREYGLEQVPVQIGGQTPTQKELAEFLAHAREDGMRVLFVQPQFDVHAAEMIAKELGAKVVALDPLEGDVLENLRKAAAAIAEAFGPQGGGETPAP